MRLREFARRLGVFRAQALGGALAMSLAAALLVTAPAAGARSLPSPSAAGTAQTDSSFSTAPNGDVVDSFQSVGNRAAPDQTHLSEHSHLRPALDAAGITGSLDARDPGPSETRPADTSPLRSGAPDSAVARGPPAPRDAMSA